MHVTSSPTSRSITALWAALIIASATIATAWFFQLALGYIPCKLCLQQRIPYYVGIPLAIIALVALARGAPAKLAQLALLGLALIFITGAVLGAYHAGVEWGLWLGPADCGGFIASGPAKVGDLMSAIESSKVVSCTHASWRLFGLSMAGWNAVVSLIIAAIAAHGSSSVSQYK
jgi:disulfide bond formation protein DsbB